MRKFEADYRKGKILLTKLREAWEKANGAEVIKVDAKLLKEYYESMAHLNLEPPPWIPLTFRGSYLIPKHKP